jgi:alpha-glucan,water dikinase
MEEWHQKLHNNTTPDDVVICEAYLAFLRGNGDLDLFYRHLQEGGVTRKRLKSYERPIKAHPNFIGHLKEKLIHDFENFLGVLKDVHLGTDLGAAIHAARPLLDPVMHELVDFIWWHRNDGLTKTGALVGKITKARKQLKKELGFHRTGVRDLLFLDLALEDFLRVVVERNLHLALSKDQLVDLIAMMLENRSFTDEDPELMQCIRHWKTLKDKPRYRKKWSLHAHSVLERLGRLIGGFVDRYYQFFQQKAELLGKAFNSDSWTINIFTEEVVRGRPAFVLVMLLRHLTPILRRKANLGNWQVVSPGQGAGRVEVTSELKSVQGKKYDQSTVIVTDKIAGDEEIPQGITAIITPDTTDIVSHVAIRARNAHVLIATCYDIKTVDQLKLLKGQNIKLNIDKKGDVVVEKGTCETARTLPSLTPVRIPTYSAGFTAYAVGEEGFNEENVGGKSKNLKSIRSKLPEWIKVPGCAAIPFGVFQKVLEQEKNNKIVKSYKDMTVKLESITDDSRKDMLKEIRKTVMALEPPDELESSFYHVIEKEGILPSANWESAWMGIKSVWSSKWNERAFLSRVAQGIPHENLVMAVLIQEIVEAEYSFVIHTQNPFTGDRDEIYSEVVLGLGETLVGNYPGRALSFSLKKGKKGADFLSFPSKSTGLFGTGLILRSDSNGEDLAGYAGAGLYDSVMLTKPDKIILDYSKEPLVWDELFQKEFLATIGTIAITVEDIMGSAQDIEGAYNNGSYYVVQTRPQMGG